jgi:hypothetical protein
VSLGGADVIRAGAVAVPALTSKDKSNLKARGCLAGVAIEITDDDRGRPLYIVSKWARVVTFDSLDDVERFLAGLGAPAP